MSSIPSRIPIDKGARTDLRQRQAIQTLSETSSGNVGGAGAGAGLNLDTGTSTLNINAGSGLDIGVDPFTGLTNNLFVLFDRTGLAQSLTVTADNLRVKLANEQVNNPSTGNIAGNGLFMGPTGLAWHPDNQAGLQVNLTTRRAQIKRGFGLQFLNTGELDINPAAAPTYGFAVVKVKTFTGADIKSGPDIISGGATSRLLRVWDGSDGFLQPAGSPWVVVSAWIEFGAAPVGTGGGTNAVSFGTTTFATRFANAFPFSAANSNAFFPYAPTGAIGTTTNFISGGEEVRVGLTYAGGNQVAQISDGAIMRCGLLVHRVGHLAAFQW